MNKPKNDEVRGRKTFDDMKLGSTERLERWKRFGYRLLLLGMTPEKFMDKFSMQHALLYSMLIFFHSLYALYEAIVVVFWSRSLLEQITHFYITTYVLAFNCEWNFMLMNVRKFHENEIYLENFESTRAHFDVANQVFERNLNGFFKFLIGALVWWTTNSTSHLLGPLIQELLSLFRTGEFIQVYYLPQIIEILQLPVWCQVIMFLCNAIATFLIFMYVTSNFIITGLKVVKIKTQCDILNEALRRDTGDESNIKAYIKDHIKIIGTAKELNYQLAFLSEFVFTACYLEFACQMFSLTLFELDGPYYFVVGIDLISIFLILAIQCGLASTITHALDSVSTAVYETQWYRRNKDNSLDVLIMTQMAQRTYTQKVWLGSMRVDRAASLSLVRSSYAMYTILMIFQDK